MYARIKRSLVQGVSVCVFGSVSVCEFLCV